MAEFCHQCAKDIAKGAVSDFFGMCDRDHLVVVLCEGCGPIQVDYTGQCQSKDCLQKHGE
jgi:hypothetical protein